MQPEDYAESGYAWPLRAFPAADAAAECRFMAHWKRYSHRGEPMPQNEPLAPNNMLSRGQEIAVEIDPARTVSPELEPGEFSLHHIGIAHGSGPNTSGTARMGLAVLARGQDPYGHFDLVEPPTREWGLDEDSLPRMSLQRKLDNNATRGSAPR